MSDDLDQLIRKAASAHLALAPASVLTTPGIADAHDDADLVSRAMRRAGDPAYLAQLAPLDPEPLMMSEPDHDPDRDSRTGASTSATASPTEDSGLHDIRALAQTTKLRISRRMPAITDDDLDLASTTGQLKAIALPEPALVVALPDLPRTEAAEQARATAAAVEARGAGPTATAAAEVTPIDSLRPKKRTALWLGLGGVAAAAAIVAVVMSGGGKGDGAGDRGEQVAASEGVAGRAGAGTAAPAPAPVIEPAGGDPAAPSAAGALAVAARDEAAKEEAPGTAAPPPPAATGGAGTDDGRVAATTPTEPRRGTEREAAPERRPPATDEVRTAKPAGGTATGTGAGAGAAGPTTPRTGTPEKGAGGKVTTETPKAPAGGAAAPQEKSIDDLLGDATGGSKKPAGGDSGPKPDKKSLDGKDIKAGMAPIAGRAQACYDQHGVAGHVKVKATVDPSGKVTNVSATGEFAGTPTGACVAAAVKAGASFPAWDGAPMTVNYSYTLNEQ